jgi:hypothetical protein
MKTKNSLLLAAGLLAFSATALRAQIAINNTAANPNASAVLDLNTGNSGNKGFLAPQASLLSTTDVTTIPAPATGLIVYNSNASMTGGAKGYYFWNGSAWASMDNAIGGSGTNNYVARWTPNGTTLGVGIIQDDGLWVGINNAPVTTSMLYVNGGTINAIYGNNTGSTDAIIGNSPNWVGVYGDAAGDGDIGVWGEDDAAEAYGLYGTSISGTGVYGYTDNATGEGVYAYNSLGRGTYSYGDTGISAVGIVNGINAYGSFYGINDTGYVGDNAEGAGGIQAYGSGYQGIEATGFSYGVMGFSSSASYGAIYAEDDNANAVQAVSSGNIAVNAAGGTYGLYATTTDATSSYDAVYGYDANGEGVVGSSYYKDGIAGYTTYGLTPYFAYNGGGDPFGADFQGANHLTNRATYIDLYNGTEYKVIGGGVVSTTVADNNGNQVVLHAPETPEVYFEDYGQGQLVNGKAHIDLDPTIAKNVIINEKHPLRAYIQLEGDCNGVYVTNKTANGFDVVELQHGTSSSTFQWHIVCNRADEVMPSGKVSKLADLRFENAPDSKEAFAKGKQMEAQAAQARINANTKKDISGARSSANANKNTSKSVIAPKMSVPQKAQLQGTK